MSSTASGNPSPERRFDLDWLRVLAFALLIPFHAGMPFTTWGWHIRNGATSMALEIPMEFMHHWRLPLLFMISGAAARLALGRRSGLAFAGERLRRLGLPLVFGILVVVPPQVYCERVLSGAFTGSYFDFYPHFFDGIYPTGNFSWHHLWYILYVLIYSLVSLPLLLALRGRWRPMLDRVTGFLALPGAIVLLALPVIAIELVLDQDWPETNNLIADWNNLTVSLILFLYGYAIYSSETLLASIERQRRPALMVSLALYAVHLWLDWSEWHFPYAVFAVVDVGFPMLLLMAIVGYAAHYLRQGGPMLSYATEAVYPFYILHQTVIVVLAFYITRWDVGVWPKYLTIVPATFVITWAIYEGLVRRNPLLRPCFGLKPAARPSRPADQPATVAG